MSLPTRERELKHRRALRGWRGGRSLPTRERELKRRRHSGRQRRGRSLPTRERELKRVITVITFRIRSRSLHGSVN